MGDELRVSEHDGILELVIDRPHKANAMTDAMFDTLRDSLTRFEDEPLLRVMLIRSIGKLFSAGADIGPHLAPDAYRGGQDTRLRYKRRFHDLFDRLENVEKPVVVAHQGACIGGALELSLSCDFRLAAASARYLLPEHEFALLPGAGGISRLTRLCGPHWARWMIMAGEPVDAEQALRIGLVHTVYPDETFAAQVDAFCAKLARGPMEMMAMAKQVIELSVDLDRTQARNAERIAQSVLFTGPEHPQAVEAWHQRKASKKRPAE